MRKDVKAGLVLALGVVIVAGWYYSSKKSSEPTIPLAKSGEKTTGDTTSASKSTLASRDTKKPPSRETKPRSIKKPTASAGTENGAENVTGRPDSNQDRIASSKQTDGDTKRSNQSSSTSTQPGGKKNATAPKGGLDDLSTGLADLAKPKTQAIPPIASGDRAKGADAQTGKDNGASANTGKGKDASGDGASPERAGDFKSASTMDREAGKQGIKKLDASKPNLDGSERYIVQPGDSFTVLAEVYYGSQSHAGFLMRANPHVKDPKRLLVGTEIRIPELPKDSSPRAQTSAGLKVDATPSGRTYVVKAGDSLTSIAEKQLGATARWQELYELNKDVITNPDVLRSGVVLVLPKT
jgi:nucleoid-associated protein YgaU